MARPITWQDVAGPAQTPGTLLAMNQSARQVGDAFTGIGETLVAARDENRKANTEAAVASIANAADPTAAAAAVGKGWQFDPLAIAGATNARKTQLSAEELGAAQLQQSLTANELSKRTLQDREDEQLVAAKFLPVREAAIAGKPLEYDKNDPWFGTKAGGLFLDRYDEAMKYGQEQRNDQERLRLARAQAASAATTAKAASEQMRIALARRDADDLMAGWRLGEGANADAASIQRQARLYSEQTGAGAAYYANLVGQYGADGARGLATTAELNRSAPGGVTYKSSINALVADNNQIEAEKLSALRQFDVASAGAAAMKENDYRDMTAGRLNQAVLDNNKNIGAGLALDWETRDVQDRRDAQLGFAKAEAADIAAKYNLPKPPDGFVPLTPAQEANLVELTIGNWSVLDAGEDSDAAKALREQYIAFNLTGGDAGLAQQKAMITSGYDVKIADNAVAIRDAERAAMGGKALPRKAREAYERTPEGAAWKTTREKVGEKPYDFVTRTLQGTGK